MLKDEAGSVDPVGVFWSGARASGNNVFRGGGSIPLCLLERGDEVANIVDSSLIDKRIERSFLSRVNTRLGLAKYLGVLVLSFPHLKSTATLWSENMFEGRPSDTSNRPPTPGKGEGGMNTHAKKRRRAVTADILLRDACLGAERAKRKLPCHG